MKRWWFNTSALRTVCEAVLLIIVLRVVVFLAAGQGGSSTLLAGDVLIGPLCAGWAAVRMRVPNGTWLRQLTGESLAVVVVGVVLTSVMLMAALGGSYLDAPTIVSLSPFGRDALLTVAALLVLHSGAYVAARCGARVWVVWQKLRHTRYLWSLTNTILLAALLAVAPLALLLANVLLAFATTQPAGVLSVLLGNIPVLLVLMAVTVAGVLCVLPAAFIIAFFSARRFTRRLETLTHATSALRNKQYDTRIAVTGADEVAQLQHTFNAMAVDLERAIHDVQAERDAVQTLLDQRRQLIANVSHELRTPVATLRGYLDSTVDHWNGVPATTLQQDLLVMQHETMRLHTLIDDLFTLARAEVHELEYRPQSTDVNVIVQRCVEAVAPQAWQHTKVDVVADLAPLQAHAQVDAARTEQIIFNLLHNAVRHTPPGGIVAASVQLNTNTVDIVVRDTGEGIAPDELPHVWERFYRAKNASGSGSGLGLALVKELAETMGGSIGANSVLGEGSRFIVRLPRGATG